MGSVAQISAYIDENQIVQCIRRKVSHFFVGNYNGNKISLENFWGKVQKHNLSIIYKDNIKEKFGKHFFISL